MMNEKDYRVRFDMETIDKEDTLTLVITLPENGGSTKIGEIQINIMDLYAKKRKTFLIGVETAIELRLKYELVNDTSPGAAQNDLNTTAASTCLEESSSSDSCSCCSPLK